MIDFRPAIDEDVPRLHTVWWAADPFDAFNHNPWFGHVIRTGSMMLATIDRRPVGFAGVRQVAGTTVVSDCFVDPEHQGQGVGTELLSRLVPRDRPVMTLASSDPKARSLYRRLGMAAQWDCHYLEGDPGEVERVVGPIWEASGYPVEESDLPHLRDDLSCRFLEAAAGHAAVAPDSIESSVAIAAGDPLEMLSAFFGWAADRGDNRVKLHLSDHHPAFTRLIAAGFVVTGTDTLMASSGARVPDPTRVTFNGDILRLLVQ